MCHRYNLHTRKCACGVNTLAEIPKGHIGTIIPDTNHFLVGDNVIVNVETPNELYLLWTDKIKKVWTSGTSWFYQLECGKRVSDDHLMLYNKPTREFNWGDTRDVEIASEKLMQSYLLGLKNIFEGPGWRLHECCHSDNSECPWVGDHQFYEMILKYLEHI